MKQETRHKASDLFSIILFYYRRTW